MPKKKPTQKRTSKKPAAPKKRATSGSTPAPVDPIQAALARRRAALIGR